MASGNPDNENELDDPEVDVSGMIAEVGGESGATVQALTLRTRGQLLPDLHDRMNPANSRKVRYCNNCLVHQMVRLIMCPRLTLIVPLLVRRHAPTV